MYELCADFRRSARLDFECKARQGKVGRRSTVSSQAPRHTSYPTWCITHSATSNVTNNLAAIMSYACLLDSIHT